MNKLGFYIENTTVTFLRDALRQVKPSSILIHAGDRGLLREIRRDLSPDSFVIGRIFVELADQISWLDSEDPAARGRAFADRIINYDFGLALEKGANGRLLIDAWMSLNEVLPGPASFPNFAVSDQYKRRAAALDAFQVAFREQLQTKGLEAVAFNFAAGNYIQADHYLDWFPRSLEAYRYLGFHEYGWPTLMEDPARGTATSALFYRRCLDGIRREYGQRHQVIITEAGLARMYKYPHDGAGDVGWLYPGETISEQQYWESLQWYNAKMGQDDYVLGACLFQVGHSGRWESFRHLGKDNQGQPLLIISKIATLSVEEPPEPPEPPKPPGPGADLPELQRRIAALVATLEQATQQASQLPTQVAQSKATLDRLVPTAAHAATLPAQLEDLQQRLDWLETELDRLEAAGAASPAVVADLQRRIGLVRGQIQMLLPEAQKAANLQARVVQAQEDVQALGQGAQQAEALRPQLQELLAEAQRLAQIAGPPPPGPAAQPPMRDLRRPAVLPPGERGLLDRYPSRNLEVINRILVHHTMTRTSVAPQDLAKLDRTRGQPGVRYHFLVNGDGTTHWMQPFEALLPQTRLDEVNSESVAVALAGNFTHDIPSQPQLEAAADVIAWILGEDGLGLATAPSASAADYVFGRSELDASVISPGNQWLQGARFKDTLLDAVEARMKGSR